MNKYFQMLARDLYMPSTSGRNFTMTTDLFLSSSFQCHNNTSHTRLMEGEKLSSERSKRLLFSIMSIKLKVSFILSTIMMAHRHNIMKLSLFLVTTCLKLRLCRNKQQKFPFEMFLSSSTSVRVFSMMSCNRCTFFK